MNRLFELSTGLSIVRHHLSEADVFAERALLEAMRRTRAAFAGSRRDGYDEMTADTPLAAGVTAEAVDSGRVRGWWVRPRESPATRAILFIHGGAYMLGSAQAYRGFASQLAARTGVDTFVLEYPLAPERPFPAAYHAAVDALEWLDRTFPQIALAGDSAGGGLALALLGGESHRSSIASVVGFSPWTDLALTGESFNSKSTVDPVFEPAVIANAATLYLSGTDPRDGRASPLYAVPDRLPPILLQVGTNELLFDDARRYAAFAAKRGGDVRLEIFEGLHHVFQRAVRELASARRAFDDAAAFISGYWR